MPLEAESQVVAWNGVERNLCRAPRVGASPARTVDCTIWAMAVGAPWRACPILGTEWERSNNCRSGGPAAATARLFRDARCPISERAVRFWECGLSEPGGQDALRGLHKPPQRATGRQARSRGRGRIW